MFMCLFLFLINQGGPGSVRLRSGSGMMPAVFVVFQHSLEERDGSVFGSCRTVPTVQVLRSVPEKVGPTIPVSGCRSVAGPP